MAHHNRTPRTAVLAICLLAVGLTATAWAALSSGKPGPLVLSIGCLCGVVVGALIATLVRERAEARRLREKLIAQYIESSRASEIELHTARQSDQPKRDPAVADQPKESQQTALAEISEADDPQIIPAAPPSQNARPNSPQKHSRLNFSTFARTLCETPDAISYLKFFVGDVRTRQANGHHVHEASHARPSKLRIIDLRSTNTHVESVQDTTNQPLPPCPEELWLCDQLEDAGLFNDDVEMPLVQAVRPRDSHMVFLRPLASSLSYAAMLRIIELEAALNRVRLASSFFSSPHAASERDLMMFAQRFESSVCGQWHEVATIALEAVGSTGGEWEYREAFSTAVETAQLPYRLSCSFRSNLGRGAMAIEIEYTPPEVFPKVVWNPALDRAVPTTARLREMAASTYAARVALLLASVAFACSDTMRTVSVAAVSNTGTAQRCYYSVEFDRLRFETVDLSDLANPLGVLQDFGATIRVEGGALRPVIQQFALDEERFCPKDRYEPPALSSRSLTAVQARALGCTAIEDLEINEDVLRRTTANQLLRQLGGSVSDKVSAILSATKEYDATIAEAGKRTVAKLISGEVDDENTLAVEDEFVNGDAISRAVEQSIPLIEQGQHLAAARVLSKAVEPVDELGKYEDRPGVSRRYFNNYIERVLYNRALAEEGARVELVPDSYFNAHLLLSSAYYELGNGSKALSHAQRAHELDPLDERAILRMVRCHENEGDLSQAINLLNSLLRHAHSNETLGVAYYRMAFMQYNLGNEECSQACYRKSLTHPSSCSTAALMELVSLFGPEALEMEASDINDALELGGVTVAPTSFVSHMLADAARAATDAEVFPVARNLAQAYGALEGNDVLYGVIRSIEGEPDR